MRRPVMAGLLFALLAAPAAGQSRIELFGAYSIPARAMNGTFTSSYIPLILNGGTVTGGSGGQTLQLLGGRPSGFQGGLNWLAGPRAGVQVFASRASHALGGANAPNHVRLTYLSRQPPDYVEREFTYDRSFDWPATRGDFTLWRIGTNGLLRLGGRRADLTLSAGLLFSRISGQFDKASYVEFRMGGHSTLFYDEALARLRFADGWHAGVNAGADLAVSAGPHVALVAGVRLTSSPPGPPVAAEIINADQIIFDVPLARVQDHIGTRPVMFSQWGTPVFTIGLRVR